MRIIIESDEAAGAKTDGPSGRPAGGDAGEAVSAGPPPADLVEAITAAGGSLEPPGATTDATDAGPAPPE